MTEFWLKKLYLICIVALSLALVNPLGLYGQDYDKYDFLDRSYHKVLSEIMAIEANSGRYIDYRSHFDLTTKSLEYSFLIKWVQSKGENYELIIRKPSGKSIYDQILQAYSDNPNISFSELCHKMDIKEYRLTSKHFPKIKILVDRFFKIPIRLEKRKGAMLHPQVHEFTINSPDYI